MNEREKPLPELESGFQLTNKSRRNELGEVADRIMSLVKTLPGVHEDLDDLCLALFEALSNAVIHGNQEDQGKTVDICAGSQGRAHVLIAATDQGGGFDPAILQDLTSAENILAGHGRGVFLMRQLVEEVEFDLGGRQVVLHKRIASQPEIIDLTDGAMRALGR